MYQPYTMRGSLYICPDQPEEWLLNDILRENYTSSEDQEIPEPKVSHTSVYRKILILTFIGLFMLIPIGGAFAALTIGG